MKCLANNKCLENNKHQINVIFYYNRSTCCLLGPVWNSGDPRSPLPQEADRMATKSDKKQVDECCYPGWNGRHRRASAVQRETPLTSQIVNSNASLTALVTQGLFEENKNTMKQNQNETEQKPGSTWYWSTVRSSPSVVLMRPQMMRMPKGLRSHLHKEEFQVQTHLLPSLLPPTCTGHPLCRHWSPPFRLPGALCPHLLPRRPSPLQKWYISFTRSLGITSCMESARTSFYLRQSGLNSKPWPTVSPLPVLLHATIWLFATPSPSLSRTELVTHVCAISLALAIYLAPDK